jgi:aryl-alcohol dehydrogenase-like predicted oxidoreductase
MTNIKLIWGGGSVMDAVSYPTLDSINEVLDILHAKGVKSIDTARIYANSEELLGKVHAGSRFAIDSKLPGGFGTEPFTPETIVSTLKETLTLLQTDQVSL